MSSEAYWIQAVEAALEEAGLSATTEQIEVMADVMDGAHEMYGEAHGYEHFGNPMEDEVKRLKKELQRERKKVVCPECKGSGEEVMVYLPGRVSRSTCCKCNGEGKV